MFGGLEPAEEAKREQDKLAQLEGRSGSDGLGRRGLTGSSDGHEDHERHLTPTIRCSATVSSSAETRHKAREYGKYEVLPSRRSVPQP